MSASYGLSLMGHYFRGDNDLSYDIDLKYRMMNGNDTVGVFGLHLYATLSYKNDYDYDESTTVSELNPVRDGRVTYAHLLEALDGFFCSYGVKEEARIGNKHVASKNNLYYSFFGASRPCNITSTFVSSIHTIHAISQTVPS